MTEKEKEQKSLIFFQHENLQGIEVHRLDEAVPGKTGFGMSLKIPDIYIQPDGNRKIQLHAGLLQGMEYLMGAGILRIVGNHDVTEQMIALPFFEPDPHRYPPLFRRFSRGNA